MSAPYTQMCDGEMSVCTACDGAIILAADIHTSKLVISHYVHLNAVQAREIASALIAHADAVDADNHEQVTP